MTTTKLSSSIINLIVSIILMVVYWFILICIWRLLPVFKYIWLDYMCVFNLSTITYIKLNDFRKSLITKNNQQNK